MSRTVDLHHHVIPDFYTTLLSPATDRSAELDDGERRGVLGGSAARLIPRLAQDLLTQVRHA
jgi:hypothetical protein